MCGMEICPRASNAWIGPNSRRRRRPQPRSLSTFQSLLLLKTRRCLSEEIALIGERAAGIFLIGSSMMAAAFFPQAAQAQKYKIDDAIPPGAKAKVLPVPGKVTDLKSLSFAVAGKVDPLK